MAIRLALLALGDIDVPEGRLDVGVAHQDLEHWQRNSGCRRLGPEGVPQAVDRFHRPRHAGALVKIDERVVQPRLGEQIAIEATHDPQPAPRQARERVGRSSLTRRASMGAKTPSPTDRRVLRTRKALRDALIGLLLERGWDDTTVGKVCERAGVGRSTFYLHFADKEELLVGGFDDLRKALRAGVTPLAGPPLAFVRALIEHAGENQRLFRAIVGKRSGQTVLRRFRELVVDMVREDLAHSHPSGTTREAAVRFVAGALVELLTWWVEARTSLEVAAVERLFLQMANPALRAVPASTRR